MAVALVTACSSGKATKVVTVTATPKVPSVTQSALPTATPKPSAASVSDAVKAYVAAVAANDPDTMRAGLKYAAASSPAYVYLLHLANEQEAILDGGHRDPAYTVTPTNGGAAYRICTPNSGPNSCFTFEGFSVNTAGKLVSLTVNNQSLAGRLTTGNGQVVTANGVKITFLTAYKAIVSNTLVVILKVQSGPAAISANIFSATYRAPDGSQRQASTAYGLVNIAANSNSVVALAFDAVKVGGEVTLGGCVGASLCSDGTYSADIRVG